MTDYDVIPYESLPLSDAFPGKLAILGRLFGIETADPEHCRILELGCADGGNLIPLAWHNPNCSYVGIDLSARHIEAGQELIGRLGIQNIKLLQTDLLDVQQEHGSFDYIIVHGVYSWIPANVREKLLSLVRESLNENGLAYISYNTNPGWRIRGTLRDMLLYHVRSETEPHQRLKRAYEFIDVLRKSMRTGSALERYFKDELNYFQIAHPSYIYHEYLEEANSPVQFSEFLTHIAQHGLRYVCDTDLYTMFISVFDADVEQFLAGFATLEEQEQYMDFLRVRTLRQSVLCHHKLEPDYEIDLTRLGNFAAYAELKSAKQVNLRRQGEDVFSVREKHVSVTDQLTKATLMCLSDHYPDAVAIPELFTQAKSRLLAEKVSVAGTEYADWQMSLFNLFANGLIGLHPHAKQFPRVTANYTVSPLSRFQASQGNITTVWHQNLSLDAFAIRLIELFDGVRDIDDLSELLKKESETGKLDLGERASTQQIRKNCQRLLELFQHHGLLYSNKEHFRPAS